jgi:hypothetical protein
MKFCSLIADAARENCSSAWANHRAGRSAQNGGSRTATLDISAGWVPSAASILRRGHQCGITRTHTETFVLTLKRAAAVLDLMSVVVSVARDGMKSVAVSAGR